MLEVEVEAKNDVEVTCLWYYNQIGIWEAVL